ncbi:ABC transporter ATP-binding protein [Aestuariicoccus sp. MJ-SS9]|uniref:ABC transporter ATP-binding protein n=1 Tax=Aestuariicoccus sp. MJ-SS9 TaxID=3079855 RepID=UPI0029098DFB|nr:ABC transporter ATP-binding protein [Aestuariicoccus sp. MJ-SS9]MDU8910785.1 ABC transporter ATP-binding protein [Aestuariicoccus sp. MJ-SS9]
MSIRALLEDFGAAVPVAQAGFRFAEADLEAEKLEAFEQGYRAGWDDAIRTQTEDKTRIASDFAQNLQDLSFTYHEAYSRVQNAMSPLLQDMVQSLLPELARQTLAVHLIEKLETLARDAGSLSVVIGVAPRNLAAVEALVSGDYGFPLEIIADETLHEGQADIRFGETEKQIDLSEIVQSVGHAVAAFADDNQRKVANG